MAAEQHTVTLRVYHHDTDAMGVVHHANYLKYFETGRTEFLRKLGFDFVSFISKYDAQFVVCSADLKFLQPARLDQVLCIVSEIELLRQASMLFLQKIYLEKPEGLLLCQAKIRLACVDAKLQLRALPEILSKGIHKSK